MCGLFGAHSSYLSGHELEKVRDLGIVSQFRGLDSTGIIVGYHGEKKEANQKYVTMAKDTGDSTAFFQYKTVTDMLKLNRVFMVVGHCRSATIGDVNRNLAHPFKVENIFGVHNGTVSKFTPPKNKQDTESDSLILFRKLKEHGLQGMYDQADEGAMALVWCDMKDGTLNFFRNHLRTLFVYNNTGTIYWASEKRMLKFVLEDSYVESQCNMVTPMTHFKFKFGSLNAEETTINPPPPKRFFNLGDGKGGTSKGHHYKKRYSHTPTVSEPALSVNDLFRDVHDQEIPFEASALTPLPQLPPPAPNTSVPVVFTKDTTPKFLKPPVVVNKHQEHRDRLIAQLPRPVYQGWGNLLLTLDRAEDLLSEGCSVCQQSHSVADRVWWVSRENYVCDECATEKDDPNSFVMQYVNATTITEGKIRRPMLSGEDQPLNEQAES